MKFLICIMFLFIIANAREQQQHQQQQQQQQLQDSGSFVGDYPFDKSKLDNPAIVNKNRFDLNLNPDIVRDTQRKIEKRENLLDGTLDLSILQKPLYKTLKTIDTIYLHSNYITTIILPKNVKITSAIPSFETNSFSFSDNVMLLQPSVNARNGNIVISLTDEKKNYMFTIFVKQYFPELNCEKTGSNYRCLNDFLATTIKYEQQKHLTQELKFEIIETYLKINAMDKIVITKNLSYVALDKNGVTYYIIRDDEFGDIYKGGLSLAVKTSL